MVVTWDPRIKGHVEHEDGTKQLWFCDLCLTVRPPQISDTCEAMFSIANGGPKAVGIGARGTRLAIARDGNTDIVEARQLTDTVGNLLPENVLVDIGESVHIFADFGPIPPFSEAVLAIQAKRIFTPQVSFQISFVLSP